MSEGTSSGESIEDMEPVTISFGFFGIESDPTGAAVIGHWQKAVTERTDGAITFENYVGGSLLGAMESLTGVGNGIADMSVINHSYFPQELPITAWLAGMGNEVSGSTVHDLVAGSATLHELFQTNEALLDEFAKYDLKVLSAATTTAYSQICTSPVETAEQAEGKRARASGDLWVNAMQGIGMVASDIAYAETYEGLQRGVLDCDTLTPPGWLASGVTEVATEYLPLNYAQVQNSLVLNLELWESLPADVQAIMLEESAKLSVQYAPDQYLTGMATLGNLIDDGSIRVNDVTSLSGAVDAKRADWVANMPATAPDVLSDPQALIDLYHDTLDGWTKGLVDLGFEEIATDPDSVRESYSELGDVDLTEFFDLYNEEFVSGTLPK
ncbi:TRAP transporter substrate-binding protein DctP [Microbacterium sp. A84]|uniref:TRAP transporter substrate-binding protein DctP n=1 Tax=Microbacterium sp. A84 TaxID=3450715 RepID=UPI003F6E3E8A